MNVITVQNIKKYYGRNRGLEDASIAVQEGEIYGFVGPNGSGKTTLIRILTGLIQATSGSAEVFGLVPGIDSARINKDVGYMPGESFFYGELKVREVLAFFAKEYGIVNSRENELAEILDLDLEKRISALSFGNRKKVGIVAAMLHRPKLLILDEPTTGLDPLVQRTFLDLLRAEKAAGTTIFLSSHNLAEVQKVCDRVAFVKDGSIILVTSMDDLIKQKVKKVVVTPATDIVLQGLVKTNMTDTEAFYDYRGQPADLLARLAGLGLTDIVIRDATLEELFIGHYEKEELQ
ncbi:MAG: ABC transporter ATP-binding protein [bacterium]